MAEVIGTPLLFVYRLLLNRDDCLDPYYPRLSLPPPLVDPSTCPPNLQSRTFKTDFEERLKQRKAQLENHPLNTVPKAKVHPVK
jgi:hypothetical protein